MEESTRQLKAVRESVDIDRYREQLLMCALSGIPRWEFSQVLDVSNTEKIDVSRVVGAMHCIRDVTVKIIEGRNEMFDFFIDREDKAALPGNAKVEYLKYRHFFLNSPYIFTCGSP